ncbi:glycosyltransferase [Nocardioides nematodiphilus]|uniref:glycosyltransferase n=1 Tax=Nocardioides nematodiphilus TaxID=2849669 RepID=UPI001CDA3302|nr:glycosyltransferase family 2 protein [Nocardioides nematodiphilus]MCA1984750.1 glycosyltransferase family 2 protein [Nocardioides nematodiphilus]
MRHLRVLLAWLRRPPYPRLAGFLILVPAVAAAVVLWVLVARAVPRSWHGEGDELLGPLNVAYSLQAPSWRLATIAVAVGVALTGLTFWSDARLTRRARRSADVEHLPLSPRNVMARTRGHYAGEVTVTVVIPAHDEEHRLTATLTALAGQSPAPRRVIVVADNCRDRTIDVALSMGAEVTRTVDNVDKKAGALNQVLPALLTELGDNDLLLVLDADTVLEPGFLRSTVDRFTADRALMAMCGIFYGEEGGGLLGQFQRSEYERYARDLRRRRGKVYVLTGTSSVFRPRALEMVADRRGVTLPGLPGAIYDTSALTEDNELTLALKSLGALMVSPADCRVQTEVMPDLRSLWQQRIRWHRGAIENLGAYGLSFATLLYWMQQLSITYGALALGSYLGLMAFTALTAPHWVWFPFWVGVGAVFAVERVVTVWGGGWRARLLALALLPELLYAALLSAIQLAAIAEIALARVAGWGSGVVQRRSGRRLGPCGKECS